MQPLASAEGVARTIEDAWYRISTAEDVPAVPDRTRRGHGTLDVFAGDLLIDAGTTTGTVEITVEEWAAEPPLHAAPGGFAEVVETSVPFRVARVRVLAADGSDVLALGLNGGAGDYRLRLYSRFLDPRSQAHVLRLWPAAAARDWHYRLDDEGRRSPDPTAAPPRRSPWRCPPKTRTPFPWRSRRRPCWRPSEATSTTSWRTACRSATCSSTAPSRPVTCGQP
ncbi:hypothetical protein ACFQY7_50530 [Actinomadura luteofluorescens]|uniref:hypothetical protein n=1 Tax=Actinomadura luteofluorescens TaxID=46163 RepID=UPI003638796F